MANKQDGQQLRRHDVNRRYSVGTTLLLDESSTSDGKNKLPSTPLTNLKVVHHYSSAPVEEWDEENEEGGKATGGDGTLIIHHPALSPPLSFQTGGRERCLPPIVLACDSFSLSTHLI